MRPPGFANVGTLSYNFWVIFFRDISLARGRKHMMFFRSFSTFNE